MISRRPKLPMALFKITGGGIGDKLCSGFGNIAWRDMCELMGDSLGKGRTIWPSLFRKTKQKFCVDELIQREL